MLKRLLIIVAILVTNCQQNEPQPVAPIAPKQPVTKKADQITQDLQTPESVLYDADQDVYFISNINGNPTAVDDNGYISRVNAETLQGDMKWIDGAKPDVTLNAPKGMAILGDMLYVCDLTVVRKFDRKTGTPKGEVAIPGSTFLNDAASDGKSVYVSDSGLKAGPGGNFEPTGTDAVWQLTADKPKPIAKGKDLKAPNGVEVADGKVWVVTFGANELYQIDKGKKTNVTTLPKGSLDGLVHLADGSFLVSSWDAKAVYRGKPGGAFAAVIENVNSPADIGYDTKRGRLLIPHFMDNIVTVHPLK
jgi:hypothetical protein